MPAGEPNLVPRDVHTRRAGTHATEAQALIGVALERLDVAVAHLSAEHPHQRRT